MEGGSTGAQGKSPKELRVYPLRNASLQGIDPRTPICQTRHRNARQVRAETPEEQETSSAQVAHTHTPPSPASHGAVFSLRTQRPRRWGASTRSAAQPRPAGRLSTPTSAYKAAPADRLRAPCPGPGGLSSLQTSFRSRHHRHQGSGPRAALSFVLDLREVAGDWKPLLTGDVSAPS